MLILSQPGGNVLVAHAPIWDQNCSSLAGRDHLLIGLMDKHVGVVAERGTSWALGQLYGVVCPGLINARHLFQGLKREMRVGDNGGASKEKMAATWAQARDAKLGGGPFDCTLEYVKAEPNRVFAVYITRNAMLKEFPLIWGWLEHWTWIAADPNKPGAPIEWDSRYDRQLWSA